jgi:hypothetical protein
MANATVSTSTPSEQPTRCGMLGAPATMPLARVAAPAQAAMFVDPHIAWGADWFELIAIWNSPCSQGHNCDTSPVWTRVAQLGRLIVDTPATSRAGVLVQVEAPLEYLGANDRGRHPDELHEVRALQTSRATPAQMIDERAAA